MAIKYTLASENNSTIRDLEIDDSGNTFIEANSDDLATFFTQYPDTLIEGLYWGKGLPVSGKNAHFNEYLYTAEDTIEVDNGVPVFELHISRLDMLMVCITKVADKRFTIKSISINGIEVARPNVSVLGTKEPLNLAGYIENYMSYNQNSIMNIYNYNNPLEFSVVVNTTNGDTTLTASTDFSTNPRLRFDGSLIK